MHRWQLHIYTTTALCGVGLKGKQLPKGVFTIRVCSMPDSTEGMYLPPGPSASLPTVWPLANVYFPHRCILQSTVKYVHLFSIYNQTCKSQDALTEAALEFKCQASKGPHPRLVSKHVLLVPVPNHGVNCQPQLYFCLSEDYRVLQHIKIQHSSTAGSYWTGA